MFLVLMFLAVSTVVFANPLPHSSNDLITVKRLINARQLFAENPSDTTSSDTTSSDTISFNLDLNAEPLDNLETSTSTQNALPVANSEVETDLAKNICTSDANTDDFIDDDTQRGNNVRRDTARFCPVDKLHPGQKVPDYYLPTLPSSQTPAGETKTTTTDDEDPCAKYIARQAGKSKLEFVTCGGPVTLPPVQKVVNCVKGKSSKMFIGVFFIKA